VFFRAASIGDALTILQKIAVDVTTKPPALTYKHAAVWMALLLAIEWLQREYANPLHVERLPRPLRWSVYYALAGTIFMFAPLNYSPFIYFQF